MSQQIQVRRGLKSQLPTLSEGEIGYCTDTHEVFIGTGATPILLASGFQSYTSGESVNMSLPSEARRIQVVDTDKTSISLSWLPSVDSNIKDYRIYVNDVIVGTSLGTTFTITGLTDSTGYKITVRSRTTSNVESAGVNFNARTQSNFALSIAKTQYLYLPTVSWNSVELTLSFVSSTRAGMIQGMTQVPSHYMTCGSTGQLWTRNYLPAMFINGVDTGYNPYGTTVSYTIPQGVKQVIRLDTAQNDLVIDDFNIFADRTAPPNTNDWMAGTLYRIKLFQLAEDGTRILTSDYDFSYQSTNGVVVDYMGNGPSIVIHGATFIAN
jgi:hypothetical protein